MSQTVFTTLLTDQGHICNLDQHLIRLHQNATLLKIPFPEWKTLFLTRFLNNYDITLGQFRLRIFLNEDNYSFELEPYQQRIQNGYRLGIHSNPITKKPLKILPYSRDPIYQEAISAGFDDALTLSPEGYILETAYANVFWQYDNQWFTPDPNLNILYGITIKNLEQKHSFTFVRMTLRELPDEAKLYLCNSLRKVQPIISIGNRKFPV